MAMDGTNGSADRAAALQGIIQSAQRLGVELDEAEAAGWVAALEVETTGGDVVVDVSSGIFGHRVSMLDFTPGDLERFRKMGEVVGFPDRPPELLTALSISGSAAQGKVQSFPGDCDYFERIHISAPTRADACAILAREMREKALSTRVGPTYRLWEVKFCSYPFEGVRTGAAVHKGMPVSWTADEVATGAIVVLRDGEPVTLTWDEVAVEPGWCKLDWIVADPKRSALANASNMLDVTWEAPDGEITPLDGFVDPYFQEVYLEPESLPLFQKLIGELATDSVEVYVSQLEHEVVKYATNDVSWGKVARRLYNIFRLTGRYPEAVYLRELFDEPTTVLYQVAAMVRTLDEADRPGASFDQELMLRQADELIMSAVQALEGRSEAEMVRHLLALRDNIRERGGVAGRSGNVDGVKDQAMASVNEYFERRLFEVPSIKAYVDGLVAAEAASEAAPEAAAH
jgi:hypothetical protein